MGVDDVLHLIGEKFARAEWVALFLGLSGLYCALLARSGLQLGHTRGFGWSDFYTQTTVYGVDWP